MTLQNKKIFLDTDMGPDCDDAGALAILHNLEKKGLCSLLGVTHCTSAISGSVTIAAINNWFKRDDIPIGRYKQSGFLSGDSSLFYSDAVAEQFLSNNPMPEFYGAVDLMRKALSENSDVILTCVGPLNNMSNLLNSEGDCYSDKNGVELVKSQVKRLVVMGGDFSDKQEQAEFNIRCDIPAAQNVAEKCPVPIIYIGYEAGLNVKTGISFSKAPEAYPVKKAYELFGSRLNLFENGVFTRPSWDLITAYYAVIENRDYWNVSSFSKISFDEKGFTVVGGEGKDCYLINRENDGNIADLLEKELYWQ